MGTQKFATAANVPRCQTCEMLPRTSAAFRADLSLDLISDTPGTRYC